MIQVYVLQCDVNQSYAYHLLCGFWTTFLHWNIKKYKITAVFQKPQQKERNYAVTRAKHSPQKMMVISVSACKLSFYIFIKSLTMNVYCFIKQLSPDLLHDKQRPLCSFLNPGLTLLARRASLSPATGWVGFGIDLQNQRYILIPVD